MDIRPSVYLFDSLHDFQRLLDFSWAIFTEANMKLTILRLAVLIAILSAKTADSNAGPIPIGTFATVEGDVTLSHGTATEPRVVKYRDDIILRDVIETQQHAYAKALFEDDSLLSVPEQSRIEISEHVYDPARGVRSTIIQLTQGAVRALVGRVFSGTGSRFEVHTATAVAAARGTYFVVWLEPGQSTGLANIGDKGDVAFTAAGETVVVKPGYYSIAHPGIVPAPPVQIDSSVSAVKQAVQTTDLPDTIIDESPKTTLAHLPTNLVNPTVVTAEPGALSTLTGTTLSGSTTVTTLASTVTSVGGGAVAAVTGAVSGVTGAVSGVTGAVSGVTGAVSGVTGAVSGVTGALSSAIGSTVTAVTSPLATGGSLLGSTMTAVGSTVTAVSAVAPVVSTPGAGVTTAVTSVVPIISPLTTPLTQTLSTLR